MKKCPFLNQTCLQEKCQLWVKVDSASNCAITAIPGVLTRDLGSIEGSVHRIAAGKIEVPK